jgi:DNA-binding Xre family transcriptional regulator
LISYAPLWTTMKNKGVTTYQLINKYNFSRGTLDSLKQGRNVTMTTLNDLCKILDCSVSDVIEYLPD